MLVTNSSLAILVKIHANYFVEFMSTISRVIEVRRCLLEPSVVGQIREFSLSVW